MYLIISLLVLRAGCGIWLYQFLIIAYLFTLLENSQNMGIFSKVYATCVINHGEPFKTNRYDQPSLVVWRRPVFQIKRA